MASARIAAKRLTDAIHLAPNPYNAYSLNKSLSWQRILRKPLRLVRPPITRVHKQLITTLTTPSFKILHMPGRRTLQSHIHQVSSNEIHHETTVRTLQSLTLNTRRTCPAVSVQYPNARPGQVVSPIRDSVHIIADGSNFE